MKLLNEKGKGIPYQGHPPRLLHLRRSKTLLSHPQATLTGFLLTGMGERNKKGDTNFMLVDKDTPLSSIETKFKQLLERQDMGIILISQHVSASYLTSRWQKWSVI